MQINVCKSPPNWRVCIVTTIKTSPSVVRDSEVILFADAEEPGAGSTAMDPIALLQFGTQPNIGGGGSSAGFEFDNPDWEGMLTG